jgi:hypothetical protein
MNPNDPKYKNIIPYPHKPSKPTIDPWKCDGQQIEAIKDKYAEALLKFQQDYEAWYAEDHRIYNVFRHDALEDCGLLGHPKAIRAWDFAWDRGHANGFSDVYSWLDEIADILKD